MNLLTLHWHCAPLMCVVIDIISFYTANNCMLGTAADSRRWMSWVISVKSLMNICICKVYKYIGTYTGTYMYVCTCVACKTTLSSCCNVWSASWMGTFLCKCLLINVNRLCVALRGGTIDIVFQCVHFQTIITDSEHSTSSNGDTYLYTNKYINSNIYISTNHVYYSMFMLSL